MKLETEESVETMRVLANPKKKESVMSEQLYKKQLKKVAEHFSKKELVKKIDKKTSLLVFPSESEELEISSVPFYVETIDNEETPILEENITKETLTDILALENSAATLPTLLNYAEFLNNQTVL